MAFSLNGAGASHAASLIETGKYDDTSSWSFSAEDGNKLLGTGGDDWTAYASYHLGVDASASVSTKAHYGYPFGKDGKVYGGALRAIRSRASAQNETSIFDSAGHLLDAIKAKEGKSARVVASIKQTASPCQVNQAGAAKAAKMINAGQYDDSSDWSFSPQDETDLLGPDGADFGNYGDYHLGIDLGAEAGATSQYDHPYGKSGMVYSQALKIAQTRASAKGEDEVHAKATDLLNAIADKVAAKKAGTVVSSRGALTSRAYSVLEVKSVNDGDRIIEGIASTPTVDRMGDIVDPMGAKFTIPMPLLWQHQASQPVGWVEFAKPNEKGIPFTARIAKIDVVGELQDLCDKAWQAVKAGLVRAVSIGFSINQYENMKGGGWNILDWDWLELSLVTIPANAEATITNIKSADDEAMAASGQRRPRVRSTPAGATASQSLVVSSAKEAKQVPKPISEQIAAFEATRAAKAARMSEIMEVSGEAGLTLDSAQTEEYDTLADEVKAVDQHLVRLRTHEKSNLARATEVTQRSAVDPNAAASARAGVRVESVRTNVPKGTAFTRYVVSLARAKGNLMQALEISKQWHDSTPEVEIVLRAAVAAGTTVDANWADALVYYTNMASEFIEFLRPLSIVGRLTGMRRVPFNIKIPRQTTGATVNWVGEASVKPVSSLAFDQLSLGHTKIAGIIPLSEELIRFSSPSAEELVTRDLGLSVAQFLDQEFVDPSVAAVTGVNPASITNAATPITASGTTATALREDIRALLATFQAAALNNFTSGVWIMTSQQALAISLMVNALGQPQFPGVTMQGGTFVGFPIIASENVPTVGGSPADGSRIIFALQDQILLADDGQVTVDVSREASLQMDTSPDSPQTSSTVMMSLWQNNLVGIKVERYINWLLRHPAACNYINYTKYQD